VGEALCFPRSVLGAARFRFPSQVAEGAAKSWVSTPASLSFSPARRVLVLSARSSREVLGPAVFLPRAVAASRSLSKSDDFCSCWDFWCRQSMLLIEFLCSAARFFCPCLRSRALFPSRLCSSVCRRLFRLAPPILAVRVFPALSPARAGRPVFVPWQISRPRSAQPPQRIFVRVPIPFAASSCSSQFWFSASATYCSSCALVFDSALVERSVCCIDLDPVLRFEFF
jgi:hypothetical protein